MSEYPFDEVEKRRATLMQGSGGGGGERGGGLLQKFMTGVCGLNNEDPLFIERSSPKTIPIHIIWHKNILVLFTEHLCENLRKWARENRILRKFV